jgi:hypothetical protein
VKLNYPSLYSNSSADLHSVCPLDLDPASEGGSGFRCLNTRAKRQNLPRSAKFSKKKLNFSRPTRHFISTENLSLSPVVEGPHGTSTLVCILCTFYCCTVYSTVRPGGDTSATTLGVNRHVDYSIERCNCFLQN